MKKEVVLACSEIDHDKQGSPLSFASFVCNWKMNRTPGTEHYKLSAFISGYNVRSGLIFLV